MGYGRVVFTLCLLLGALGAGAESVVVSNDLDILNGDVSSIAGLQAFDGGDGVSLREAILAANATPGADRITFAGAFTINLGFIFGALPNITDDGTEIDGESNTIIINGNMQSALIIDGADDCLIRNLIIQGCVTALDIRNCQRATVEGCAFQQGNLTCMLLGDSAVDCVIGGETPEAGNIFIQAALLALAITDYSTGNQIIGNYFGVDKEDTPGLGNPLAIFAEHNVTANQITDNVIANNIVGIQLKGNTVDQILISGNSIYNNDDGNNYTANGILLESGANDGISAPTIIGVWPIVTGQSLPFAQVELFVDLADQGRQFLEQLVADDTGYFASSEYNTDSLSAEPGTFYFTATATDTNNNTSQFSMPADYFYVDTVSLNQPDTTNLNTVSFTVRFFLPVTGIEVDPAETFDDFALLVDGKRVSDAVITSVTGSGDTYVVTVDTGSGDGYLGLAVLAAGGVQSPLGTRLSADYVGDVAYTMEHMAITLDLPGQLQVIRGEDAQMKIAVAGGTGSYSYTWYRSLEGGDWEVFGSDADTVTLLKVDESAQGDYYVVVNDGNESVESNTLSLEVVERVPVLSAPGFLVLISLMLAGFLLRNRRVA